MNLNKRILSNIDSGLRTAIDILNKKEYITAYCCEGHPNEKGEWYSHIYFAHKYDFEIAIPQGYNFEIEPSNTYLLCKWCGDNENDRLKWLQEINEWVRNLPIRDKKVLELTDVYKVTKQGATRFVNRLDGDIDISIKNDYDIITNRITLY